MPGALSMMARRRRFASGGSLAGLAGPEKIPGGTDDTATGRKYTPLANDASYYTYGENPESLMWTGKLQVPEFKYSPSAAAPPPSAPKEGTNWGNVIGGLGQLGQTAALAGSVAQGFGYDNAFTQGLQTYGNALANPVKGAHSALEAAGLVGPSMGSFGSGAAANAALADAGFSGSASAAAADAMAENAALYGGAEAGGAGAGAAAAGEGAGSSGAGAGAGAGITGSGLAAGATGLGLVYAYSQLQNKRGDEKRNQQAFVNAHPGVKVGSVDKSGNFSTNYNPRNQAGIRYQLPSGAMLTAGEYNDLIGKWYGATAAPDGNQSQWQQDYQSVLDELTKKYGDLGLAKGGQPRSAMPRSATGNLHRALVQPYVKGPGTGRSDEIDAKLSDGEYVMDAETVAMLGDGSSDAGAKRLDELRSNLRKHKGKNLAKGKFSANAKPPEAYIGGSK